jgi:hypothetical protein
MVETEPKKKKKRVMAPIAITESHTVPETA